MRKFLGGYTLASGDSHISVVQAQNESDIRATVQIGRQHFGEYTYTPEMRMRWFEMSLKGDYVLKHHGLVVGYFSMQAMKKEAIERIFYQKDGLVRVEERNMCRRWKVGRERWRVHHNQ